MISRYNAWINDVALSEIHPDVYVMDIAYQPVSTSINVSDRGGQDGQHSGQNAHVKNNKVVITFMVRAYETNARQSIVQDVIWWAGKGGWLKCSDRLGQKMYVKPSKYPAASSVMRWSDPLTIELTAYEYPFWVSDAVTEVTLSNGQTSSVYMAGVWESCAEAEVTANAAVTSLTITVGDTSITFSGLSMASGDVLTISYTDEKHIMEIKLNGSSALNKRTASSADDLIVHPGANAVSFTADGNASCVIKVREVRL